MADMFNPGRINGTSIGAVSSEEELQNKLEAVGATPEQMQTVMMAYADWKKLKESPEKKEANGTKGKTIFDRAKEGVKDAYNAITG